MKDFLYGVMTDQEKGLGAFIVKSFLWVCSYIYWIGLKSVVFLYRSGFLPRTQLPARVISIGNITVGGVGKTPLVEYVARDLLKQGFKVAILTRGYMGKKSEKENDDSDEALMLKNAMPKATVLVGADRISNAKEYLKYQHADIFVMDDGFQHWKLKRDLDVVVIDASNPWGNGQLLPCGILREPLTSLKRADIFVLTKIDQAVNVDVVKVKLKAFNSKAMIVDAVYLPVDVMSFRTDMSEDLATLNGQDVCCVSSIASPQSFLKTLKGLSVDVKRQFIFKDHHRYSEDDFKNIVDYCVENGLTRIVTTQKDAVKLKAFADIVPQEIEVLILRITLDMRQGKDAFLERIHHLL